MGVMDYRVTLEPLPSSPLYCGRTAADVADIAATILRQSDNIALDTAAWEGPSEQALIYRSSEGIFQILIRLSPLNDGCIYVFLQLALPNPRTINSPFVETAGWLMKKFLLGHRQGHSTNMKAATTLTHDLVEDTDASVRFLVEKLVTAQEHWVKASGITKSAVVKPGSEAWKWLSELQGSLTSKP